MSQYAGGKKGGCAVAQMQSIHEYHKEQIKTV